MTLSDQNTQRDAATLRILGFFFTLLGVLVLVGTLWSLDDFRATVVNVGSGSVLILVGIAMGVIASRLNARTTDEVGSDDASS